MAEYIKFRVTAAKASVTLAFLALLGGLPGTAQAKQSDATAKAASFSWGDPIYLKLDGLGGATQKVFQTLEYKLNHALSSLSHKISTSFYDKQKIDTTFLKIDQANKEYYKERQVDATFLKIEDANASFLKITDASNEFLKIAGTAANSSELGGLTPDAFVQGHANVVSGTVAVNGDGKPQALLQSPDGAITVSLMVNSDNTEIIVVHNGSSSALTAVADPTAVEYQLPPGQDTQIPAGATMTVGGAAQALMTHIQIFPGGTLRDVMTLTVSSETVAGGQTTGVGQMLIGLL